MLAERDSRSMNGSRELNGHRPLKSSPSPGKKIVTIVAPKENNSDELVSITPNERNWRGICIALLVIVAVLALILFFIVLLSPPYEGPFNPGIKFTIDNVGGTEFQNCPFNGSWISGTEFIFRDPAGGVSIFNTESNTVRILINNSTFRVSNGVDFAVSADLKYILITKDVKKIYAYTKKAKYRVQEVRSQNYIHLTTYLTKNLHNQEALSIQEVMWSPRGNAIIFVHNSNIFYKRDVASITEIYQITYTGSNLVQNGVPDWIYQQEITKGKRCMWISSDGKYLAFATFNDTLVGKFKYPVFKTNNQYPEIMTLSYPKVGTVNPEVTISVSDLQNPKNGSYVSIRKPEIFADNETYFVNLVWDKNERFAVTWMNREQTLSVISICSKPHWRCEDIHFGDTTSDNEGWVEPSSDIIFSNSGDGFITIASVSDSSIVKYPQICFINMTGKITPITHGQMAVTNIRAWDQLNKIIYFEAAPEGKPTQRHVYNSSDSLISPNKWHCLTCPIELPHNRTNLTLSSNSSSGIFEAINIIKNKTGENVTSAQWPVRSESCRFTRSYFHSFDEPIKHYVLECLGPDVPKVLLMRVANNTPSYLLNNNTELTAKYARMAKPQIRILQVELDSGYQAQVKLLLPPVYRERSEREFPFVLYVKSVPGRQEVTDEWSVDWNTYLVSSLNFIVGIVDARGSSGQSDEMKFEIQRKIGAIDVEDQVAVLLYLRENLHFIDRTRTGVWGRGYGGYLTGRLIEQDNGTFQCGIAVAPITSWAHYVSVFTERLMGTANVTDNYRGYEETDLTKRVTNFKDKKLLVIHGTADKLVHYQHSMLLVHSFSKHGVLFQHLTYPDEDHDFADSSHHVIKSMEHFWTNCFGPIEFEDYDEGLGFLQFAR